ncbi:MAG TPA: HAMP domain-containing sensor histidine kinase [Kofleriaceae bacterium]|jgi:signal transduction histidine kinase
MDPEAQGSGKAATGAVSSRNDEDRESLEQRVARLEAALAARDAFLRVATHELRGPLAAIQLQADTISLLVNQGAQPNEVDMRAMRVSGQVQRLARLLEEVLDLARASSGRLQILRGEVDLAAVVQGELTRAREDLRRAGSEVEVDIAAGSNLVGPWDQARVEHMVSSLIGAAVKSGGAAALAVSVGAADGDARIELRWGGGGIAATQVELVHGEFEKAVHGAAPGGNILSLWLAARVAEAHGGRLELEPTRAVLSLPVDGKKLAR